MTGMNDPFFQVPQTVFNTSEGKVNLPILYFDASALYAFFLVKKAKVNELLSNTGLEADLTLGSYSIAGLACYQYRDTSVGVYNEVGLAVSACEKGASRNLRSWWDFLTTISTPEIRHTGMHVLHLPVTTKAANAAGREIWGFPKFVTPIDFSIQGKEFLCTVRDPLNSALDIATLSGKLGFGIPFKPLSLTLFTNHQQHLLRATVNARGKTKLHTNGSLMLSVGSSDHAMAETLKELDLNGATPLTSLYSSCFQSRLNSGYALA